jgi:broad specificity phosphatase PhoE
MSCKNHLVRLTIVRHGETTANADGIIQGQSLDASYRLTELGVQQAKAAGQALAGKIWWKVFCSDLPRARETVGIEHDYAFKVKSSPTHVVLLLTTF